MKQKIKTYKESRLIESVFIYLPFVGYIIFMIWMAIHVDAMIPDEKWFWDEAKGIVWTNLRDVIITPNLLGYGSIYWIYLKITNKFIIARLISVVLLVFSVFMTVKTRKLFGTSLLTTIGIIIINLSCPLIWFTGKIIGPEILGYTFGVAGGYYTVKYREEERKLKWMILPFMLMGISTGIKLNYIVFAAFGAFYLLLDLIGKWKEMLKVVFMSGAGVVIGIILSNPILVISPMTFFASIDSSGYKLANLGKVLFSKCIEWDWVNSGGMNETVISVLILSIIGIYSYLYSKNRRLVISSYIAIIILVLICAKERFLGWYLMPVIFFVSIALPELKYGFIWIVLNLILMMPNVCYQIASKVYQIQNMKDINTIITYVHHQEQKMPDCIPYYFIETCVEEIPLYPSYMYDDKSEKDQIIFISQRALWNEVIRDILEKSEHNKDGYFYIGEEHGIICVGKINIQ